ncbi:MAG: class I SAM-dependent methyltransferase, partial [Bacteroidales bacterium]|nr:class I SAM-dependent methyltransferase [Bacteroidales bacterium]
SKEKEAYSYLPESIKKFPDNEDFLNIMSECGLKNVRQKKLTFGVASIYVGNV